MLPTKRNVPWKLEELVYKVSIFCSVLASLTRELDEFNT